MPGASLALFADWGGMSRPKVKCYDLRSTHALRVEGDSKICKASRCLAAFLSTPSGWRATDARPKSAIRNGISIHALRVEGDRRGRVLRSRQGISIHALRVEGDRAVKSPPLSARKFLSTPSGWRATAERIVDTLVKENFYPRPPGGGRPEVFALFQRRTGFISIHALRVEGDGRHRNPCQSGRISIHALRVEGD